MIFFNKIIPTITINMKTLSDSKAKTKLNSI